MRRNRERHQAWLDEITGGGGCEDIPGLDILVKQIRIEFYLFAKDFVFGSNKSSVTFRIWKRSDVEGVEVEVGYPKRQIGISGSGCLAIGEKRSATKEGIAEILRW